MWVPPRTTADGEVIEGHWVETSAAPPKVEVVDPAMPIPRAPQPSFKAPKKQQRNLQAAPSIGFARPQDQAESQDVAPAGHPPAGLPTPPAWVPGLHRGQP